VGLLLLRGLCGRLTLGLADHAVAIEVEPVEVGEHRRAIFVGADLAVLVGVELIERELPRVGGRRRDLAGGGAELGQAQRTVLVGVELVELLPDPVLDLQRRLLRALELGGVDLLDAQEPVAIKVDRLEVAVEVVEQGRAGRRRLAGCSGRSARLRRLGRCKGRDGEADVVQDGRAFRPTRQGGTPQASVRRGS